MSFANPNRPQPYAPWFGAPRPNLSDLPSRVPTPTQVLNGVGATTTSAAINCGARSLELQAVFSDAVTSCSLDLIDSNNTVVMTWNNVSNGNAGNLFAGPIEGVNLGGLAFKVKAYNFSGGGSVSVYARPTDY